MRITVAYLFPYFCCTAVGAAKKFTSFIDAHFRKIFYKGCPCFLLKNRTEIAGANSYIGRNPV